MHHELLLGQAEYWYPMPIPEQAAGKDIWYAGGELNPLSLAAAYRQGFFPWEGDPLGWCSPYERMIITPERWHIPRRLRRTMRTTAFRVALNTDSPRVIENCRTAPRPSQPGTWLTPTMVDAYSRFAEAGWVHTAGVWDGDCLVGGLYGVLVGSVFVGDSMFSLASGASKIGFAAFGEYLWQRGARIIDCQVYSDYMAQFGGFGVSRPEYLQLLMQCRENRLELPDAHKLAGDPDSEIFLTLDISSFESGRTMP